MKAYLVALILSICIVYCESCSCPLEDMPRARYCRADFGIKVRVLREKVNRRTYSRYYRIKLLNNKQFLKLKPKFNESDIDKKWVVTAIDDGICGIKLQKGETYLLTGYVSKKSTPRRKTGSVMSRYAPKYELSVWYCGIFYPWKYVRNGRYRGFNLNFVKETYKTKCRK